MNRLHCETAGWEDVVGPAISGGAALVSSIVDAAMGGPQKRYRLGMAQAEAAKTAALSQVEMAKIQAQSQLELAKLQAAQGTGGVPTWALALGGVALVLWLTRRKR